jgi:hypothetical protein
MQEVVDCAKLTTENLKDVKKKVENARDQYKEYMPRWSS